MNLICHNLILIDGFLQYNKEKFKILLNQVTILILIDGFLQCDNMNIKIDGKEVSQSLF